MEAMGGVTGGGKSWRISSSSSQSHQPLFHFCYLVKMPKNNNNKSWVISSSSSLVHQHHFCYFVKMPTTNNKEKNSWSNSQDCSSCLPPLVSQSMHPRHLPFHFCYLVKIPNNINKEKKKSWSKSQECSCLPPLVAQSMHHEQPYQDHHHHHLIKGGSLETAAPMVFVIMGVSGSGKTTVGELLANTMDFGFLDADDFHPVANIEKMSKGIPLNEEDRIPWLETLRDTLRTKIHQISSSGSHGTYDNDEKKRKAVLCCSALQKKYREILRTADPNYKPGSYVPGRVKFIYLEAPMEVLLNRVNKRAAEGKHFMPASLLQSQLDLLQIDDSQEKDITVVDGTLPPQLIVNDIRSRK